nr:hypothetical protein [Tanacetum cinerariifolium]
MERGFLDSGDKKKKKEGVSSTPSIEFLVLSVIAKNVKNIEGKTNVPKSILKKAVGNIVNDTHERKFGFEWITRNDDGVYLFKFTTKSGRDQVIDKIKDASKPSSSNSGYGDGNKDMNAGFTSFSTSVGGGNQLEDKDSDFYDGYEDQVVDLHGALKEYRDFMLSMSGKK